MGFWLARRGLMAGLTKLCLALLLVAAPLANPAVAASDPQDMVRSFYRVLLNNMKDGRVLGESGRLARLAPVVAKSFDIPAMTRLAIGPTWASLAPPNSSS